MAPSSGEEYVNFLLCIFSPLPNVAGVSKWPNHHREHGGRLGAHCSSWWQAWRPDGLSRWLLRWWTQMQVVDLNSNLTPEPWWIDKLPGKGWNWGLGTYWAKSSHSIGSGHLTSGWTVQRMATENSSLSRGYSSVSTIAGKLDKVCTPMVMKSDRNLKNAHQINQKNVTYISQGKTKKNPLKLQLTDNSTNSNFQEACRGNVERRLSLLGQLQVMGTGCLVCCVEKDSEDLLGCDKKSVVLHQGRQQWTKETGAWWCRCQVFATLILWSGCF